LYELSISGNVITASISNTDYDPLVLPFHTRIKL